MTNIARLIFVSIYLLLQVKEKAPGDVIRWTDGLKLIFSDFQGKPDNGSKFLAVCSSQMNYGYTIDYDTLEYDIFSFFETDSSWIKVKDTNLLSHEQTHFDIAEICSRKIKKRLRDMSGRHINDSIVYNIFMEERENKIRLNSRFDEETAHGTIEGKSLIWFVKVREMLDSLQDYKSPRGKIPIAVE